MLEVLVAILVISFGLLGLAGLQAAGLKNNQESHLRSIATQHAYEMIDRIRANKSGADAGHYNNLGGLPTDPGCITSTNGCTPAQLATTDILQWNTRLAAQMPSGKGWVCLDSTPADGTPSAPACDNNPPLTVKVWWDGNRDTSNLSRFVTAFVP